MRILDKIFNTHNWTKKKVREDIFWTHFPFLYLSNCIGDEEHRKETIGQKQILSSSQLNLGQEARADISQDRAPGLRSSFAAPAGNAPTAKDFYPSQLWPNPMSFV